jgi:hypothetical protein
MGMVLALCLLAQRVDYSVLVPDDWSPRVAPSYDAARAERAEAAAVAALARAEAAERRSGLSIGRAEVAERQLRYATTRRAVAAPQYDPPAPERPLGVTRPVEVYQQPAVAVYSYVPAYSVPAYPVATATYGAGSVCVGGQCARPGLFGGLFR